MHGKRFPSLVEKMYMEKDEDYKKKLREKGMTFVKPDVEAFRKATENVWKEFAPQDGDPGSTRKSRN